MTSFETFKKLHRQESPLILTNAWDVVSAKVFEDLGAPAIATSSAAVAWSLGYQDGRKLPAELSARVARSIIRVLRVPLSVDFENGFSDNPEQVAENIKRLLDDGVAGINLEDGSDDPHLFAKKIEAIKRVASGRGQDIFINARTDVYLASLVPPDERLAETLKRGRLLTEAGADGFFVPLVRNENEISELTSTIALPLNVLAMPGLANAATLGKLGVKRLSSGPSNARIALSHAARVARAFMEDGDSAVFTEATMSSNKLQSLFPE